MQTRNITRTLLVAATAFATLVGIVPAEPASAVGPTVSVAAPQYDSPGALVPVIVTTYNPPAGYAVSLTATASNGAAVTCTGSTWRNPVRNTVSRKCYVTLPQRVGSHVLTGTATFTKTGASTITVRGNGARELLSNGYATSTMSLAEAQATEKCHNTTSHVWLTFDDTSDATKLKSILSTLRRNNVKGRFFFIGTWARANPTLVNLVKSEGHFVANHTYNHPPLSKSSDTDVAYQIRNGVAATTSPKLMRPPYGAGALTSRVASISAAQGYKVCRWTTDTYDWENPSATVMAERVRYGDYRTAPIGPGGVVLMHSQAANTPGALQGIIDTIRAKGLTLQPRA